MTINNNILLFHNNKVLLSIIITFFVFILGFLGFINMKTISANYVFNELNSKLLAENPAQETNKIETSSLKTSNKVPIKNCSNGVCVIDFGDYIITDVPEGFKHYISVTGKSGANKPTKLMDSDITDDVKEKIDLENLDINGLIDLNISE